MATGQKKVMQTADQLWETLTRVNADLGRGDGTARGTIPLHPVGHWRDEEAIEYYGKKVFDLESIQIMRGKNWFEQGLRKDGVREYWVLERVIAACMEYSVDDFEHLMRVFFIEWEKDLKPDGRTNKNKDQWTRWCEIHLVRHHRASKAQRCLDVLEALGLLYPGWWKQVYALNHNTPVYNDTYAGPWDIRPSVNVAEMDELNQKYARVPHSTQAVAQAAARTAASNIQTPAAGSASRGMKKRKAATKTPARTATKTSRFQEHLDELDDDYADSTPAQDADNESEESFIPEDYYPDYIHEYDAVMGVPKTTNPQLAHTVGFAPAAEAWRNLNSEGFEGATRYNPQINATRIIDSVAQEAVRSQPAPRATGGPLPSTARTSAGPVPPKPYGPQPPPRAMPTRPQPASAFIDWSLLDERDFVDAVTQVDADFLQGGAAAEGPLPNDLHERQRMLDHRNDLYNAVAVYKNVPAADLARRNAERAAEQARYTTATQAPEPEPEAEGEGINWNYTPDPAMYPPGMAPGEEEPIKYTDDISSWPIQK
ncbi:hypothetical protein E4T50_04357 [Aureobasidium sp. EXF-12298]|nr:hypothetical protein E4T50_04357 [Aureobasidium sp. EXF-12298]